MKYADPRPYTDPERAARHIVEIASTVEPAQDGLIHVELINGPFLFRDKGGRPAEYGAGMKLAPERGWLTMHESRTYVRSHRPVLICSRDGRATVQSELFGSSRPKVQRGFHRQALSQFLWPSPRCRKTGLPG